MPRREHKTIPIGPERIGRIVAKKSLPKRIDYGGEPHRRSGMSGIRPLHRIHREGADGINAQPVARGFGAIGARRRGTYSHETNPTDLGIGSRQDNPGIINTCSIKTCSIFRAQSALPWSAVLLKELHRPLVLLRRCAGLERPKIATPAGPWIFHARVEPVFA